MEQWHLNKLGAHLVNYKEMVIQKILNNIKKKFKSRLHRMIQKLLLGGGGLTKGTRLGGASC
jgi:hypothetical protein